MREFHLELRDVTRLAESGSLCSVSVDFTPGILHALVGDAGCGTLLRIAGLLEQPDKGELFLARQPLGRLGGHERARLRSKLFGYVFATPHLLPSMTVVENVAVPFFKVPGSTVEAAKARAAEVLDFVQLTESAGVSVGSLSRGEQQRAALARSLVHAPAFLIVELPDTEEASCFLDLLRAAPARFGTGVIVTLPTGMDPVETDRVVTVRKGAVHGEALRLPQRESSPS